MPSDEHGRPAVVSQFFSKSSTAQTSPKNHRNGLKKQTSIISLSSSDDVEDDDIQVIKTAPAVVAAASSAAKKRKAAPIVEIAKQTSSKPSSQEPASKKVKVAPLFERVKNGGGASSFSVKKEDNAATVQRLQQWKFAAGTNGSTPPPETADVVRSMHSSSPLPEIAASTQAVQARRAQVRKMLLGIDIDWRKPPDEEAEPEGSHPDDSGDASDDSLMEDGPIASTSKLPPNGRAQSKASKKSASDAGALPDLSKFAADKSEKSKKGKSIAGTDKKGKAKAVEPAIKYTPLEQQVIDIKQKYVC